MVSRVIKRITLAFILAIAPHLAHSETAHALGVARLELAALQIEGQLPQCSGMLISSDLLVTSDECLLDAIGSPLGAVSVLPGLNTAEEAGAHAAKPGYREFGVAAYPQGNGISILRLGAIEGRPPPRQLNGGRGAQYRPEARQSLEVLHYGGGTQPV